MDMNEKFAFSNGYLSAELIFVASQSEVLSEMSIISESISVVDSQESMRI